MSSPIYNPPVPYTVHIAGGFMPGRMVRIQGRVNPSANYFTINLQTGPNPYDDIALHVNPRLSENAIVRNSKSNSSWGVEERHGPPMSIYRDQNFEILILSEPSIFKIAVNGQHFTEFTHRVPIDRVSYLVVEGDLTISLIQFDGTAQPAASSYMPTAPPMGYAPPGGACPYPPASALPTPGFTMPVAAGVGAAAAAAPYPSAGIPAAYPPSQQPYGGYPPSSGPSAGGYYPQQPAGYPTPGQPGYYQPQGAPQHGSGSSGGGLMSDASKLIAGGLAGVGLAKVANKIPGLGGGGHGHGHNINPMGGGYGGYPHGHGGHGGGGGGGMLGKAAGLLGPAAAMGVGGALMGKKAKKSNKLLKYGVPIGGAVVGGYALKKGMKGFRGGSSSSSSSSSEEE